MTRGGVSGGGFSLHFLLEDSTAAGGGGDGGGIGGAARGWLVASTAAAAAAAAGALFLESCTSPSCGDGNDNNGEALLLLLLLLLLFELNLKSFQIFPQQITSSPALAPFFIVVEQGHGEGIVVDGVAEEAQLRTRRTPPRHRFQHPGSSLLRPNGRHRPSRHHHRDPPFRVAQWDRVRGRAHSGEEVHLRHRRHRGVNLEQVQGRGAVSNTAFQVPRRQQTRGAVADGAHEPGLRGQGFAVEGQRLIHASFAQTRVRTLLQVVALGEAEHLFR
eukprot:CAMPEP_0171793510 /NCGR_PEP_ID=MMETSP0991-20121206/67595_1 /TAXON_ID=483369 /ORGANISM="non described non described, Strain CCMP2098" /LENGTH=273 /DNA_ID=CAMNT_0012403779 /DNA_START=348 /DNA_END=1168 /DNA_ORIENTATION=-